MAALESVAHSAGETVTDFVILIHPQLALGEILVESTLPSIGALGEGTGIVGVIGAALAQRFFPVCPV